MTYLLDTQIIIWFLIESRKLSLSNYSILRSPLNRIVVSYVTLFEIAIKQKLGKLPEVIMSIPELVTQFRVDGFELLPIAESHLAAYDAIPLRDDHRDPFDRLLMATAHAERMSLISADEKFIGYPTDLFTLITNE